MSLHVLKAFYLDFGGGMPPEYIFAKQGERYARILVITPLCDGTNYTLPEGVTARFCAKKPDGTEVLQDARIECGNVVLALSENTLSVPGLVHCEIRLFDSDQRVLGSQMFYLKVQPSALCNVESSDEYTSFLTGLSRLEAAARYLYIRYSNRQPVADTDVKETPGPYIGIAVSPNTEAPTAYTAYTWYEWKSGDYAKPLSGIPAADLADGVIPEVPVKGVNVVNVTLTPDADGIVTVSLASDSVAGVAVMKSDNGLQVSAQTKEVSIASATEAEISARTQSHKPIVPSNLDSAVKHALTDGVGNPWSDGEKAGMAQRMRIVKTAPDNVLVAGAEYYLGTSANVALNFPLTANAGETITVVFYSGTTATVFSATGNVLPFDFEPSANARCEINALFDGVCWSAVAYETEVNTNE